MPIPYASAYSSTDNLIVTGLVSNILNLTYGEVQNLPMIWEIAHLQCVGFTDGTPYNWTGVPLFHLLNLADVQPEAKEVVFRAEDDFLSSISIEKAMHPTTMLALKVNGSTLPYEDGYWTGGLAGGYPYRAVVPCKWGYKWVSWIDEIEVVDYDYKGFYESLGYSDEANIENCTKLPKTTPAYALFNSTWRDTYECTVFPSDVILEAGLNKTTKLLYLHTSDYNTSENYLYITIPKRLLTINFTVFSDGMPIECKTIQGERSSFIRFTLGQGIHTVKIAGRLLADVTGRISAEPDSKVDMRDVGVIARLYGAKAGDTHYTVQYDINEDEMIDIKDVGIAAQDFGKIIP